MILNSKQIRNFIYLLIWTYSISFYAQQSVDSTFVAKFDDPTYAYNKGPSILIDQGHNNGTRMLSSFSALAETLQSDGYTLSINRNEFIEKKLLNIDVLVIIDALAEHNINNWELPTPSAFNSEEIKAINNFVKEGGSLLLVADHMPYAGASQKLAQSFGVNFINGFAIDTLRWDLTVFNRNSNSLMNHPIIQGRSNKEKINEVGSYFGQSFSASNDELTPILKFTNEHIVSYEPKKAWRFDVDTKTSSALSLYQGLAGNFGKGRVVVLGDSSLVGAYLIGESSRQIGMNSTEMSDNFQFMLNTFHWLSKLY